MPQRGSTSDQGGAGASANVDHVPAKQLKRDYGRAMEGVVKGRATQTDLWLGDQGSADRPLLVFHHIKKTAGTALRLVIHTNMRRDGAEHAIALLPRKADRHQWWRELYESSPNHERLLCVAGHEAAFMLAVVEDRPVEAFTVVRGAVSRVLSRYYFLAKHRENRDRPMKWTLESLYAELESGTASVDRQGMCNGQSRTILAPYHDVDELPLFADDPAADVWRQRLFEVVEKQYLLGVQEHFDESVRRFAKRFGWKYRKVLPLRVNLKKPSSAELPAGTKEQIRRFNWLDDELHSYALGLYERTSARAGVR